MEIFAETVSDFTSVDNLESPRASKVVKLQKALESCRMPSPNSYQYYKIQWIDETDTFRVVPQVRDCSTGYNYLILVFLAFQNHSESGLLYRSQQMSPHFG